SLLVHAGEESRQTVARFHHARARCLYQSGDYDSARKEIRRAVDAWRGIQHELSDDDLNALFQDQVQYYCV
ncbi:MAG: tetratricopeptide repeat protein, partial [Verrucomicrobiales bacterium]|nr:tetratricopeptide repeat protein [Verrucomicrobiales bacterium]